MHVLASPIDGRLDRSCAEFSYLHSTMAATPCPDTFQWLQVASAAPLPASAPPASDANDQVQAGPATDADLLPPAQLQECNSPAALASTAGMPSREAPAPIPAANRYCLALSCHYQDVGLSCAAPCLM